MMVTVNISTACGKFLSMYFEVRQWMWEGEGDTKTYCGTLGDKHILRGVSFGGNIFSARVNLFLLTPRVSNLATFSRRFYFSSMHPSKDIHRNPLSGQYSI